MERIDRTEKKSKKKLVVVLKNRSKKLRPRKEKKEIEYIQKGGADYTVTLYSNYEFTVGATKTVADKLQELNIKNDRPVYNLTNIDEFFAKCVKFLTDEDFATLYLKSNFDINEGTNNTKINTSADTLLHFKSLILYELCARITNLIQGGPVRKLSNTDNDEVPFLVSVFSQTEPDEKLKDLIIDFNVSDYFFEKKELLKKVSISVDKVNEVVFPASLYLLNLIVKEKEKKLHTFDLDKYLPQVERINNKFGYTYDFQQAANFLLALFEATLKRPVVQLAYDFDNDESDSDNDESGSDNDESGSDNDEAGSDAAAPVAAAQQADAAAPAPAARALALVPVNAGAPSGAQQDAAPPAEPDAGAQPRAGAAANEAAAPAAPADATAPPAPAAPADATAPADAAAPPAPAAAPRAAAAANEAAAQPDAGAAAAANEAAAQPDAGAAAGAAAATKAAPVVAVAPRR